MDDWSEEGGFDEYWNEYDLLQELNRVSVAEDLDSDQREWTATKADDAEVPLGLWRKHFVKDGPLKTPWTPEQCDVGVGLVTTPLKGLLRSSLGVLAC